VEEPESQCALRKCSKHLEIILDIFSHQLINKLEDYNPNNDHDILVYRTLVVGNSFSLMSRHRIAVQR